jgi:hypothetical protein
MEDLELDTRLRRYAQAFRHEAQISGDLHRRIMMRTTIGTHGAPSSWLLQVTAAAVALGLAVGVWVLLGRVRSEPAIPLAQVVVRTVPADGASNVARAGDIRVEFATRPDQAPSLRLEPADGKLYATGWKGPMYSWRYEGLGSNVQYRAILDQASSPNGTQRHFQQTWRFTTEPTVPRGALPCRGLDLSVRGGYVGGVSGGGVSGGIVFTNRSAATCTLEGRPKIQPTDSKGVMAVTPTQLNDGTPGLPVALQPGQEARVGFVWLNYCQAISGALTLTVTLPNDGGQFEIAPDNFEGRPQTGTPSCRDPGSASILSIGRFMAAQ